MATALSKARGLEKKYGINDKQHRFAELYVQCMDGKQAAIEAGYSPKSAAVMANRLLNHVGVAGLITELLDERSQRTQITADQVLRELATLGLSSIDNYEIDEAGFVALAEGAPQEAMRCVKKIKRTVKYDKDGNKNVETEIELWDKINALRLAGKHLGMFIEQHAHLIKGEVEHKQVWEFGGQTIEF